MAEIMIFTADQSDAPAPDVEELPPLAFQIAETEDRIELTADVTGFDEEDIEITIGDGELTVSGYHEEDEEADGGDDEDTEEAIGFTQSFAIPDGTTASQVEANVEDGVLTIVVDKQSGSESAPLQ